MYILLETPQAKSTNLIVSHFKMPNILIPDYIDTILLHVDTVLK